MLKKENAYIIIDKENGKKVIKKADAITLYNQGINFLISLEASVNTNDKLPKDCIVSGHKFAQYCFNLSLLLGKAKSAAFLASIYAENYLQDKNALKKAALYIAIGQKLGDPICDKFIKKGKCDDNIPYNFENILKKHPNAKSYKEVMKKADPYVAAINKIKSAYDNSAEGKQSLLTPKTYNQYVKEFEKVDKNYLFNLKEEEAVQIRHICETREFTYDPDAAHNSGTQPISKNSLKVEDNDQTMVMGGDESAEESGCCTML